MNKFILLVGVILSFFPIFCGASVEKEKKAWHFEVLTNHSAQEMEEGFETVYCKKPSREECRFVPRRKVPPGETIRVTQLLRHAVRYVEINFPWENKVCKKFVSVDYGIPVSLIEVRLVPGGSCEDMIKIQVN
jgi:hypothetical protein